MQLQRSEPGDRLVTANGCHGAGVVVLEGCGLLAIQPAQNVVRSMLALLHGNRCHHSQRRIVFVLQIRRITDHIDFWMPGHLQRWLDFDTPLRCLR